VPAEDLHAVMCISALKYMQEILEDSLSFKHVMKLSRGGKAPGSMYRIHPGSAETVARQWEICAIRHTDRCNEWSLPW